MYEIGNTRSKTKEMSKSNWYSRGREGLDKAKKQREASQKPNRVWIPKGKSKNLIPLENDSFNINEYSWKTDQNQWRNWATMPEDAEANAVFLQRGLRASFTGMYTVVNCTEYEDNQGCKHNYVLQFLPAKEKGAEMLEELKSELEGGLRGTLLKAKRFEDGRTLSAGDMYTPSKQVDLTEVYHHAEFLGAKFSDLINQANEDPEKMVWLQSKFALNMKDGKALPELVPFNYMELLKPPSLNEAKVLLACMLGGSNMGAGESEGEDPVPF